MGSAIFFDLVKDKTIDGYDPRNVVTIMTLPLTGTLVPAASGRTEVPGIGVQSYPIGWFTRSNFGGRFSAMLKFAGWDGVVIEGKADQPVWLDIPDCPLDFRDLGSLEYVEQFVRMMASGDDGKGGKCQFAEDVKQGFVRAAKKWGRLDKDLIIVRVANQTREGMDLAKFLTMVLDAIESYLFILSVFASCEIHFASLHEFD